VVGVVEVVLGVVLEVAGVVDVVDGVVVLTVVVLAVDEGVVVVELGVVDVVVVVLFAGAVEIVWQSCWARLLTVLTPWSRLARRVGLTLAGRFET
jgi:hypothetical protein